MNRVIKVSFFLFLLLFCSGRLTLIIHEFLGHALPVAFLGHEIHHITFQFFGDAWINYHYKGPFIKGHETSILSGGIISEMVIACLLLIICRFIKHHFIKFSFTFLSAILIIHALHYSILALYFQYGDGRYFNFLWGEDHAKQLAWGLIIPLTSFSFAFSKEYSRSLTQLYPYKPILFLAASSFIAISIHASLGLCGFSSAFSTSFSCGSFL